MKVFISWSGDLSRSLAVELRDWLPMVIQQVNPWISSRDIDPGQRWALVLGRELEQCDFAVICLTPQNRNSPWILFEAGAIARSLSARVVPLLFEMDTSDLDGPLAQFQSVRADETGLCNLVRTLFESTNSRLEERQRDAVIFSLWPIFQGRLARLIEQQGHPTGVVSVKDLMVDLAASSTHGVADADVLQRLKDEQDRLRTDLEYLNAQVEKLAQTAPFSLVERAIEPTEQRLGELNLTVKQMLDLCFVHLKPHQIQFLRTLVFPNGVRRLELFDTLSAQGRQDLLVFEALNLTTRTISRENVWIALTHDLIADYIDRTYGAA